MNQKTTKNAPSVKGWIHEYPVSREDELEFDLWREDDEKAAGKLYLYYSREMQRTTYGIEFEYVFCHAELSFDGNSEVYNPDENQVNEITGDWSSYL